MNLHSSLSPSEHIKLTKYPIEIDIPSYGIYIAESHHQRGFIMNPMKNNYIKVYYISNGEADCYLDKERIQLKADDLLVIPEQVLHYLVDRESTPLSLYILAVQCSCLQQLSTFREQITQLNDLAIKHKNRLNSHDYMAYEIPRLIRKILFEQHQKSAGYVPAIQATLLNIVIALNRIYQNIPVTLEKREVNETLSRIEQVANYISSNFYDPISVENVARMACLSVRQFTNQFKAVNGVTFMQYLHYQRVRFAQKLLSQTNQPIASICFESGFNDLAHFYRVFKKISGISPRKYRIYAIRDISEN